MNSTWIEKGSSTMDYVRNAFGSWVAGFISVISSTLFAYWDQQPEALKGAALGAIALIIADTILGSLRAAMTNRFNSNTLASFFQKLGVYMGVLLAAYGIDQILRAQSFTQTIIVLMICFREATSAMENSAALGFKWPQAIVTRLEQLRDQVEEGEAERKTAVVERRKRKEETSDGKRG